MLDCFDKYCRFESFYHIILIHISNLLFNLVHFGVLKYIGGTFALYSLLCRYARIGLIPSQQVEDREVSNYRLDIPDNRVRRASWLKSQLESRRSAKLFLLFATMLGTSMVIGDGVLTPCISGN